MSLDGMFGGLGAGFGGKYIFLTVLGSFVVSFCAVLCGCRIGMQASKRWKTDVSWLGGVLFVILAFQKII
jgi:putative Mn2+ efflux pump MntP